MFLGKRNIKSNVCRNYGERFVNVSVVCTTWIIGVKLVMWFAVVEFVSHPLKLWKLNEIRHSFCGFLCRISKFQFLKTFPLKQSPNSTRIRWKNIKFLPIFSQLFCQIRCYRMQTQFINRDVDMLAIVVILKSLYHLHSGI